MGWESGTFKVHFSLDRHGGDREVTLMELNLPRFMGCMLIMAALGGALAVGLSPTAIYITAAITAAIGIGLVMGSWKRTN